MKLTIDEEVQTLTLEEKGKAHKMPLYSNEAFQLLSRKWLQVGADRKYSYRFSWMGRPIIQMPEDIIRLQEIIYKIKPDVILETGIAHGGSLILSASLCKLIGKGRVIGVDIEIRPHNLKALEEHELRSYLTLIEGSSIDPLIVNKVKSLIKPGESVLIILDSNHSKKHVFQELEAYHELVSPDSYIAVADGVMKDLCGTPKGKPEWEWDSPYGAVEEFIKHHPEFLWETPQLLFNESEFTETDITYFTGGWLKKISEK